MTKKNSARKQSRRHIFEGIVAAHFNILAIVPGAVGRALERVNLLTSLSVVNLSVVLPDNPPRAQGITRYDLRDAGQIEITLVPSGAKVTLPAGVYTLEVDVASHNAALKDQRRRAKNEGTYMPDGPETFSPIGEAGANDDGPAKATDRPHRLGKLFDDLVAAAHIRDIDDTHVYGIAIYEVSATSMETLIEDCKSVNDAIMGIGRLTMHGTEVPPRPAQDFLEITD